MKSAQADFFCHMNFYVYILYSAKCDKYYVGHSEFVDNRLYEHKHNKSGKFSKICAPWQLIYTESHPTRSDAVKREREIKSRKSRKYIESLIGLHGQSVPS